jgi:CheY-like chemotaxis protein
MSRPLTLAPYFHPTTVVLVDDNEAFMRSMTLEMPSSIALHGFTDPEDALAFLDEPIDLAPLVDRCFTLDRSHDTDAVIHLNLGLIEQEINYRQRFRRVSAVLVDYAMPSVDGLAFCERMTDPYARRAMLTGVADERLAVEAFNAGLIHRFIPKHRATAVEAVVAFIAELEREYFHQYLARLRTALAIDPPGFLVDPSMALRVSRVMQQEAIVEYYLVNDPPGFLMLRSNGSVVRLVLLDETARQRQIAFVRRHEAPAEIRRGIERGELVGLFSGDSPADYYGDEAYPWRDKVHPASALRAREPWVMALVRDAATDIDFDPARSSYDAFLAARAQMPRQY